MQLAALPSVADAAVFGFLALVVVLTLGLVGALAYLDHRKTMALVESGQYVEAEAEADAGAPTWVLAVGLVLLAIGLGGVAEALVAGASVEGLTTAFVGLAALAYYALKRRANGAAVARDGRTES